MKNLIIILSLLIVSCGSRKVEVKKANKETVIEVKETKKDSAVLVINKNVIQTEENDIVIYEPIDNEKEIVVDGLTYKNTRLTKKKEKVILVDTSKIKEVKIAVSNKQESNKTKEVLQEKNVDRKESYFKYFLLIFVIIILAFLVRKYYSRFFSF
jgi:uncharacterized membrane protein YvbJ